VSHPCQSTIEADIFTDFVLLDPVVKLVKSKISIKHSNDMLHLQDVFIATQVLYCLSNFQSLGFASIDDMIKYLLRHEQHLHFLDHKACHL
jgi:hypothetical protein